MPLPHKTPPHQHMAPPRAGPRASAPVPRQPAVSLRLRRIYKDPETLAFQDPSPWRWADFTAHPRVLTVGDRTGVKVVDTQVRAELGPVEGGSGGGAVAHGSLTWAAPQGPPGCGLLLFRGGAEASCQKGERVLLTQYLGGCSPESLFATLHLVCTQVSGAFSSVLHCLTGRWRRSRTTAGGGWGWGPKLDDPPACQLKRNSAPAKPPEDPGVSGVSQPWVQGG